MAGNDESSIARHSLVTGPPGIGKTTIMTRLADLLDRRSLRGFYTGEIRECGRRVGFSVTTFSGRSAVMAHVNIRSQQCVGRYGVDVAAFEALVLPELVRPIGLTLIDEIGKMECFSSRFVSTVKALLDGETRVVATVAAKGSGFIADVRNRSEVRIWRVTSDNRDLLPMRLAALLRPATPPRGPS